jgi:5-methylthioadenosine/S-adenosylhomocysteine deaminase
MLRNGITAAHDETKVVAAPAASGSGGRQLAGASGLDADSIDTIMSAYRDCGIRAVVGVYLMNKPFSQCWPYLTELLPADMRRRLDAGPIPSVSELLAFCEWMIGKWNGADERLHVALAPAWPPGCTDEFMLAMEELSRTQQLPISTHVQESKVDLVTGSVFYGKTYVEHLVDLRLLTPRLSLHHGVWLTDRDIELLAEAGTSVVHNPVSNLRAKQGLAPIVRMLRSGVNVALGCDNSVLNDSQNLFEAMKLAAMLPEVEGPRFGDWQPAREALRMATAGGAKTILLDDELASLQVGKRADIIILDLKSHAFTPLNDPVLQLVYGENGRSVDTVLVEGRVVMEGKKILTVDEEAILEEANEIGESLRSEHEKAHAIAGEVRPYLEQVYWRCVRQDVGFSRYTGEAA